MTRWVRVKALKSFNEHQVGDMFMAPMNEPLAHLIVNHYLEFMEDPQWHAYDSASSPCDGSQQIGQPT